MTASPLDDQPPSELVIRRATRADLPHIGRLGALLVSQHHDFDSRRFLPATDRTKDGYARFLGERRRHGVGRALLDAVLDYVRSRGLDQIVLGTAQRNEVAQRFFAEAGFRPTMVEMTREI